MSTREIAISILNDMTEEQLRGFIMMFGKTSESHNNELISRINDIENGKNLSETFSSVEELMENLNAED